MEPKKLYGTAVSSPIGALRLIASDKGLCALLFPNGRDKLIAGEAVERADHPMLVKAASQLSEYFAGKRRDFDLPFDLRGSVFQLKAWQQLCRIPYAQTISYGEQAKRLGDAKKARAVGMANGRNPLAIIVPCHRVIGASGHLTGFGGGLKTKQYLLEHERRFAA